MLENVVFGNSKIVSIQNINLLKGQFPYRRIPAILAVRQKLKGKVFIEVKAILNFFSISYLMVHLKKWFICQFEL